MMDLERFVSHPLHFRPVTFFPSLIQIARYNPVNGTHNLHYEDGEIKDSDMSKRGFRVCSRSKRSRQPTHSMDTDAAASSTAADAEAAREQRMLGRRRVFSLAPLPPAEYTADTSSYVIAAVNRFGDGGGMNPLAQRLCSGSASFGEVLETFRLGKALRHHASSRAMKEVNWTLKECAAVALISALPESMRATTKAEIAECVSSVKDLALSGSGAKPPSSLSQELEQLELALAMKVRQRALLQQRGLEAGAGGRNGSMLDNVNLIVV